MEELNPWLDPNAGKHKNKKSTKPIPDFKKVEESNKCVKENVIPVVDGNCVLEVPPLQPLQPLQPLPPLQPLLKINNPKVLDFFTTLVEDSLDIDLPPSVSQWAIENFDEKWLEEFLADIKILKEDILDSKHFPSNDKILLLKLIFLLRQGIN